MMSMGDLSSDKIELSFTETGRRMVLVSGVMVLPCFCLQAKNNPEKISNAVIENPGFSIIIF